MTRPRDLEIERWIVEYVASTLDLAPEDVDVNAQLDDFGIDSASTVSMAGSLEEWLGIEIDPTLVFDYPTIRGLAQKLAVDVRASG